MNGEFCGRFAHSRSCTQLTVQFDLCQVQATTEFRSKAVSDGFKILAPWFRVSGMFGLFEMSAEFFCDRYLPMSIIKRVYISSVEIN